MSKQKHIDEIYKSALFFAENIENIKDGTYKSDEGNYEFKLGTFGEHLVTLDNNNKVILINVPLFEKKSIEMRVFSVLWCFCKMETDIHIHYQSRTQSYIEADSEAFKIMIDKQFFKDKASLNHLFTDYSKVMTKNPDYFRAKTFFKNVKKVIKQSKITFKKLGFFDLPKWFINTSITLLIAFILYVIFITIYTKSL